LFPSRERLPQNLELDLVKADLIGEFPPVWTNTFDLVHQRFIWASLPDPSPALKNLIKATKPGGWVQLVDVNLVSYPESQHQPPAFSTLRKLARALFADPTAAAKQTHWLRESGMTDVNDVEFDIAAGSGHKIPVVGLMGSRNMREVLEMFMQAYARKSTTNLFVVTL
jgi:SAM-dependent methyltransferase